MKTEENSTRKALKYTILIPRSIGKNALVQLYVRARYIPRGEKELGRKQLESGRISIYALGAPYPCCTCCVHSRCNERG